jgi:hypothetical protein
VKIVASLTENVKKIALETKVNVASDNKENSSSKRTIPVLRKQLATPTLDQYLAADLHIEQIEAAYTSDYVLPTEESEDEPIDPTYAMDYIAEIMNLLYTLEKKYTIQSSFLTNPSLSMSTMANGSAIRP